MVMMTDLRAGMMMILSALVSILAFRRLVSGPDLISPPLLIQAVSPGPFDRRSRVHAMTRFDRLEIGRSEPAA